MSESLKERYRDHAVRAAGVLQAARANESAPIKAKLGAGKLRNKEWLSQVKKVGGHGRRSGIPVIISEGGAEHSSARAKSDESCRSLSSRCSLANDLGPDFAPPADKPSPTLAGIRFRARDVLCALRGLDVLKAIGPDCIPARVLKFCADELCRPLARLFSWCLRTGVQPNAWKGACVVPVHKKPPSHKDSIYRPTPPPPIISKVVGGIVSDRPPRSLERNNLPALQEFGFRRGLGATDLLTKMHHEWPGAVNNGGFAVGIAWAFDKVLRAGALHKAGLWAFPAIPTHGQRVTFQAARSE